MSGITTHVLDTSRGRPAASIPVRLERFASGEWRELARAATNADGRWNTGVPLETGSHRLVFDVRTATGENGFYSEVQIQFEVRDVSQHYHVPLLLSPFGYTTYRGS